MKHPVGGFEPQPLLGSVVKLVLNHSQFFLPYRTPGALLGHVLTKQAVEVLITGTRFSTRIADWFICWVSAFKSPWVGFFRGSTMKSLGCVLKRFKEGTVWGLA